MSLFRRAAKRDSAEAAIVDALRKAGWSVESWSQRNCPDLVLSRHGVTLLAEVKTGRKKLRPGQQDWIAQWQGRVVVLRSVEDALRLGGTGDDALR